MVVLEINPHLSSNHVGYVTSSTLVQLKALNKGWVSVAVKTDQVKSRKETGQEIVRRNFADFKEHKNDYVLQLVVVNQDLSYNAPFSSNPMSPDVIYISYSDYFNVLKQNLDAYRQQCRPESTIGVSMVTTPLLTSHVTEEHQLEVTIKRLPELVVEKQRYVASKASVSLVSCPSQMNVHQNTLDEALKDYFATPKLLRQNEVFTVDVQRHHPFSIRAPYMLWFVVTGVIGSDLDQNEQSGNDKASTSSDIITTSLVTNTRFVIFEETDLMLLPSKNAFLPRCPCVLNHVIHNNVAMFDFLSSEHLKQVFKKYCTQLNDLSAILQAGQVQPSEATVLLEAPRGFGKGLITQAFCLDQCMHYFEQNCYDLIGESMSATEKRIEIMFTKAVKCTPCVLYLKNIHVLCRDKEGFNEERRILQYLQNQIKKINLQNCKHDLREGKCQSNQDQQQYQQYPLLIVGSTHKSSEMSSRFYSMFLYHIEYELLSERDRELLLRLLFRNSLKDVKETSLKTTGFILSDLIALFKRVVSKSPVDDNSGHAETKEYYVSDILPSIEEIRSLKSGGSSDSLKIPKVSWKDVGGLEDAKKDIFDTIELPMKFPELFQGGLQRSGLLFYGPPGCGKTLLAKAIATEFTLNFYNVKGPELLNMYVGQSEENVREVFKKARRMAPCVVFFDELDSLAPARGRSGDSGGVMDRVVSQLLAELDGMHSNTDVFIIGATNRPDLLDTALLRPGRFDKMIYVGVPEGQDERMKLLKAVTRQIKLSENLDLDQILDMCPENLTGADFKSLASDALKCCFRRIIMQHKETGAKIDPASAVVTVSDFSNAIANCIPSVSMLELERYKSIRDNIKMKDR